jgi:TRAP transporter TAXI family solute receptor
MRATKSTVFLPRLKRLIALSGGALALLTLLVNFPAKAAELVPFVTPPAGGGAYVVGAGLISVVNKYSADTKLVHESSTGTMDIVRRLQQREAAKKDAMGIFGTVDAWNAYRGMNEYKGKPFTGLRMITFIMATDVYFAVPANSSIKTYADAKGKRIGLGGAGSTTANTAQFLLEQAGVTKKDFKPYYYSFKEVVEGIQDGSLDGGFVVGAYPIPAYSELATQRAMRIVPVDDDMVKRIVAEHPYYFRNVIRAKSYKGLDQDTTIMGFTAGLWTHAGVSGDYIYRFLKTLFDHRDEFYATHPASRDVTLENALRGLSVPLHPGAEKYYREIGIPKK